MKVIETGMEGFLVIEPDVFSDERECSCRNSSL